MLAGGKRFVHIGGVTHPVNVWCISDIHYGNKACALNDVKRTIKTIKDDPYALWVGIGDYAEYIGPGDWRFDPSCISEDIKVGDLGDLGKVLTGRIRDLFESIKYKCLGLGFGNHEDKFALATNQGDLHSWLCTELSVPNLAYSSLFDVSFSVHSSYKKMVIANERGRKKGGGRINRTGKQKSSFRIYTHHGAGGATTEGGKLNRLIKFMDMAEADIYFMGHVHGKTFHVKDSIAANRNCNRLTAKRSVGVISGTYLKTYAQGVTTYGEKHGYSPTPLGSSRVTINLATGELNPVTW